MIVGSHWAYAHLPKTGGDAVATYLTALVPSCRADEPASPRKHDPFWIRKETHDKPFFLLGIRRLPDWTWSLMHEFNTHANLLALFGTANAASVDFALSRPFADEYLLSLSQGVRITHWIRQECLLQDVLRFVGDCLRPAEAAEAGELGALRTKTGRRRNHPFSSSQCVTLHRMNPHWSRTQQEVYT